LSKAKVRAIWVSLLCILGQRKKRPNEDQPRKEEGEKKIPTEQEKTNQNQVKQGKTKTL
jgi:hypothetical protein